MRPHPSVHPHQPPIRKYPLNRSALYELCADSLTSYRIYMCTGCETGPTVYRPYPRRLESLTVCIIVTNEALSSQLFKDSKCWSRQGLNQRPPTRQTGAYPTELTGRRLIHSKSATLYLLAVQSFVGCRATSIQPNTAPNTRIRLMILHVSSSEDVSVSFLQIRNVKIKGFLWQKVRLALHSNNKKKMFQIYTTY